MKFEFLTVLESKYWRQKSKQDQKGV